MLKVDGIRVGYGARTVLDGVSFELAAGECVAILGANGAGKTTLLRALAGLVNLASGSIALQGRLLRQLRRRELARHLAYVAQESVLLFSFRVLEVVLMGRYARRPFAPFETREDLQAARTALEAVSLWELRGRRFDELSGGERRRVFLAQALCQEAELLLLDEPTASLDVRHAHAFWETLRAQQRQRRLSVLVATHDLDAAAHVCERALLIADARVAGTGPTLDVLASAACAEAFGMHLHIGRVPGSGRPFCVPA